MIIHKLVTNVEKRLIIKSIRGILQTFQDSKSVFLGYWESKIITAEIWPARRLLPILLSTRIPKINGDLSLSIVPPKFFSRVKLIHPKQLVILVLIP